MAQTIQSKLVLAVTYATFLNHTNFVAAFAEAAAKASGYPKEDIYWVAHIEIFARLYTLLKDFNGLLRALSLCID